MSAGVEKSYEIAKELYGEYGVDTDKALEKLKTVSISMHCWQGDDVGGFEKTEGPGGGIMATGNFPGKATNGDELRMDLEKTYSLIPGTHRLNLHSIYAETDAPVARNKLDHSHFSRWIDWAREQKIGLDFNGTFFAHPMASTGFTLASHDKEVRSFWIEHGIACRKIAEYMGKEQGTPCVHNIWIPDGFKDVPANQGALRGILKDSLDTMLTDDISKDHCLDAVESKLFGIGSESCVIGSHEFYMGYALQNNIELCLDSGHFHPTESIAGKLSSVLCYLDRVLLHLSRGVRWDSDHVVLYSDDIKEIALELIRNDYLDRVNIATDFFDGSINRIAAWTIGMRNVQKALLFALLEPHDTLRKYETQYDYTARLALMEEAKTMPMGAVWDYFCMSNDVPVGISWLEEVKKYEDEVLSKRG